MHSNIEQSKISLAKHPLPLFFIILKQYNYFICFASEAIKWMDAYTQLKSKSTILDMDLNRIKV